MINTDGIISTEEGALLSIILFFLATMLPVLQEVAYFVTILVAIGTLFVNRRKYGSEIKKTWVYKKFKKNKNDEIE